MKIREIRLQSGKFAYKTGFSFTKWESRLQNEIFIYKEGLLSYKRDSRSTFHPFFTSNETLLLIMVLKYIYLATFRNHITPIMHIRKKNPKKISQLLNKLLTFPHLNDNILSEAVLYHLTT